MIDTSELNEKIVEAFGRNEKISKFYEKLASGKATYEDANKFAGELGNICRSVYGAELTPDDLDDFVLSYTRNLITANATITNEFCEGVQATLNELGEIGLNPVVPQVDADRIDGIIENARGIVSQEQIETMLGANMIDLLQSVVDEFVRRNADFQKEIGMEPIVKRTWVGTYGTHDTRRTDYCHLLAGTYLYGEQPNKFFERHKGCRCVVEFYPNKKAKARVASLEFGSYDADGALWNTLPTTIERRRKKAVARQNARKRLSSLQ